MLSVLAIVCPPLAVFAAEKSVAQTAVSFCLTLLFYFPGMFHALATVERRSVGRRYESVMRVLERRVA